MKNRLTLIVVCIVGISVVIGAVIVGPKIFGPERTRDDPSVTKADDLSADKTKPKNDGLATYLSQLNELAQRIEDFAWSMEIEANSDADKLDPPDESQFKPRYELDKPNKNVQSWKEYWDWVKKFYEGRRVVFVWVDGWTDRSNIFLAGLDSEVAKKELITYLNVLGRIISAEWSKDNNVRRISTDDVTQWSKALQSVIEDDLNGDKRLAALHKVADQVADKLSPDLPKQ